ncbi:hypothetical protein FB45DRAFT_940422 [Roridomyces roridus]|uniref:F-box domain-containing protein n=1 Tax=Roridomyces roridus TaxID=1738132 RepID=A0AAD7B6R0_9AGAR|nr:hypothetical protein FB45DRAFT_940422 [Roridomyces roridus]
MSSVFPLSDLGFDVVELVLGQVSLHSDLVSFAACSRACHELVVPRHSEYRILRLRELRPQVWAHLARRPDLARYIREVCWESWSPKPEGPERYPSTLLDSTKVPNDPETVLADICKALKSMEHLQSFTWSKAEPSIYRILQGSPSLFRLCIHDVRRDHGLGPPDAEDANYPLWHISNLKELSLSQRWWPQRLHEWFLRCPDLQVLQIRLPPDPLLAECSFPHLRRLDLLAPAAVETSVIEFLQRHPTIEDLQWFPHTESLQLGHGSLPRLKRLTTTTEFACTVLSDPTVPHRAIECVGQLSLDERTWRALAAINTTRLKELQIWRHDNLETIHRLAELVPQLRRLEIPRFGLATRSDADKNHTVDDYIEAVSRFPCLEFLDSSLWLALGGNSEKINALASRCPNLQRLGQSKSDAYVEIVLIRKGGEVVWEEE